MFKNCADKLSLVLASNKIISYDNFEAYSYGIELFLFKGTFFLIALIISLLTNTFIISAIFIISYTLIREYSGGYHCKTAEMCLLVSIFIYLILLMLCKLNLPQIENALFIFSLLSIVPIIIFSPVENINKPLTESEKKKFKVVAIIIGLTLLAAVLLTYFLGINYIFYSISYALTADAVLIILSKRRKKNEEDNS